MTTDLAIVLILLAVAVVMFVVGRPRMDVVALIMIAILPLSGTITVSEALAGFSDSNVILIAALFIIGEGLVRTGVARRLGDWLSTSAGANPTRLVVSLMLRVGGLGALMSSTAVVAIFIPVVLRICRRTSISPARLMMPLSVAALISGMLTLVATAPNLVVNAELARHGISGFQFFSFTPFGVPVLALGIAYMAVVRRLLGRTSNLTPAVIERPSLQDWVAQYGLIDRAYILRVRHESPLVDKRVGELSLRAAGVNLLAIERGSRLATETMRPTAETELRADDKLLVDVVATVPEKRALLDCYKVDILPLGDDPGYLTDAHHAVGMAEAMLSPESSLIDHTVLQARIRSEQGLTVIGLRRGSEVLTGELRQERLRLGDTVLLVGLWSDIGRLQTELNLPAEMDDVLPALRKAPQALATLALVVVLMVAGIVPNVQAALFGCLLMGLFGCVDLDSAYRAISWKSLILIVGMMPFSDALQRTGGVQLAADTHGRTIGRCWAAHRYGGAVLTVLGLFISNTATAVLMAPVALALASDLGASPYPFAMIVALASSTAFMTPISSPVNTLVVGPGNYAFSDFVRIGTPLALIVLILSVLLVPWLLPLH